jgi:hypothetical protein
MDNFELLADMEQRIMRGVQVIIENAVLPKFDVLAEGQQAILEQLVPRTRVDELEDEIKFLKAIVRQMSNDLQELKKAQ